MDLASHFPAFRAEILSTVQQMIVKAVGRVRAPIRVVDVPIVLGSQGTALTTSNHIFLRIGLNGTATVLTWSLAATVAGASHSGSVTLDIQVGSTLAALASICGTAQPALAAAAELDDQAPTVSWTTTIADPQWMLVKPTAVDGVLEVVGLTLRVSVDSR